MKKYYIPSINGQTNKNFKIGLVINDRHYGKVRDLVDKSIEIIKFDDAKKDYKEYVIKNNITLQTRHDCDDYMDKNYIKKIHEEYEKYKNTYNSFVLNFHPIKLLDEKQKEYTHSRDYSKTCSMFSTLIQKKVTHGIMDVMHDHLVRITKNVVYIPETFVKLVIHGNNSLSKLREDDKFIRDLKL
jgi:hypothetical protein